MADETTSYPMPGRNEFSADEEQQMRAARLKQKMQRRYDQEVYPKYAPSQAEFARKAAAKRLRNSRSMPDNFPVPQYGEED